MGRNNSKTLNAWLPWVLVILALPQEIFAKKLEIVGVNKVLEKNIRAFVELGREKCKAPRWRVRRRFQSMDDQVHKALEGFGYYTATLEKKLKWTDDCWQAKISVEPGRPVTLRQIDFSITGDANRDSKFKASMDSDLLAIGEPLRHQNYETTKQRLQFLASERGYFDGEFEIARIDVWPEKHAADITLHYDSGERYVFGEVTTLQDVLEPKIVDRFIDLEPGAPYSGDEVLDLQQRMNASGYFSAVTVRADITARQDKKVPVTIELSPSKRINYTIGGGFSTDSGPRLRSGYENRRVNRRGHQFRGGLLFSEVLNELAVDYKQPLGERDTEWLGYGGGFQFENTDTSESDRFTLGIKRVKQLGGNWLRTDGLSLQLDRFQVADNRDDSRLLMPSVAFGHKRIDDIVNPNHGHSLSVEFRGAEEILGSSTSFVQLRSTAKLIRKLGANGRILIRAQVGTTAKSEFIELPPDVRFFAGGIETVRGYGFETLGPKDDTGLVIGGSHLLTASFEYDQVFYRNFAYAFFVDAGNAFDGANVDARVGVGLGFKWRSPIGPFRVYLAHPLNFSDRSVRLHVSIGPDL